MYDVGEVLYLLSNKNNKIVPARVESVVTVKRPQGVDITHEVTVPGHENTIQLEKLSVKIFPDPAKLRKHLLNVLEKQVDEELNEITKAVMNAWGHEADSVPSILDSKIETSQPVENVKQDLDEVVQIELENGIKANVHIPEELR